MQLKENENIFLNLKFKKKEEKLGDRLIVDIVFLLESFLLNRWIIFSKLEPVEKSLYSFDLSSSPYLVSCLQKTTSLEATWSSRKHKPSRKFGENSPEKKLSKR